MDAQPAPRLQQALLHRIRDMPAEAKLHNRHQVKCILPASAARVLQAAPQLVAPAVEAFYLRDPLDLKAANKMAKLMPLAAKSGQPSDSARFVVAPVRFTRCLYAQLNQQQFH